MGGGGPRRPADPQPAGDGPVQRRRDLARAGGRDRRGDPRLGPRATPRPRSTRRARRGWASTSASVLDPLTMRVHGLDGLRVVDASAMPYVTNGNIYAPVMMLAEKAADLILGQHAARPRADPVLPAPAGLRPPVRPRRGRPGRACARSLAPRRRAAARRHRRMSMPTRRHASVDLATRPGRSIARTPPRIPPAKEHALEAFRPAATTVVRPDRSRRLRRLSSRASCSSPGTEAYDERPPDPQRRTTTATRR